MYWWPPRVGDFYNYNWGKGGGNTIILVVDVFDPIGRVRHGYVLTAQIIGDNCPNDGIKLVLGATITMNRNDLLRYGSIELLSRVVRR